LVSTPDQLALEQSRTQQAAMSPVDYLEKLHASHPALAEDVADMAGLYQRKLWHQLTLKVEECFSKPEWSQGGLPLDFYNNFIAEFGYKINLLKLSQFAVHVAKSISDPGKPSHSSEGCLSSGVNDSQAAAAV
jgi:26S proteasome regulatory subunit N9